MTGTKTKVNGRSTYHLNGRGHTLARTGQSRPGHYSQRKGRQIVNAGTATTGWEVVSGCTMDTASVTNPEGVSQTLVRFTGTADNTTAFFQCVTAPFNAAQLGREGIEFDLYYAPGEPYSDIGGSGIDFRCTFINAAGTVSINCNFQVRAGWQRIRLRKAEFTTATGGDWDTTSFNRLLFRIAAKSSVTHTVQLRNVGYMANTDCKICVQFDDIGESVYTTALPIMRPLGIPGSCAVISDAIGQDAFSGYNRLTVAEMLEMKRLGWDFVNHTKTHGSSPFLTTASQADCLTEIATCRDAIISNGIGNGTSEYLFCAPYGEFTTNYWAAAAEAGMKMFRGTVGDNTTNTPRVAEADVILSPLTQVPVVYVVNTDSAASILALVDSMIGRGGYLILLFHHIVTTPGTAIEYSTANFTTIMNGLSTRAKDLEFVNMSQLYEATRL